MVFWWIVGAWFAGLALVGALGYFLLKDFEQAADPDRPEHVPQTDWRRVTRRH